MNIQVHRDRGVYGKLVLRVDWSIDDIIIGAYLEGVELTKDQAKKVMHSLARDFNPYRGINTEIIKQYASSIKGK